MESHLIGIDGVGKRDYSLTSALARSHGVALVGEQSGGVAVGAVDVQSRFIVVLHAVSEISLQAEWQRSIVGGIGDAFSEIALIEATVVAHGEHQRSVLRLHHNLLLSRCSDTRKRQQAKCRKQSLGYTFHVVFS